MKKINILYYINICISHEKNSFAEGSKNLAKYRFENICYTKSK